MAPIIQVYLHKKNEEKNIGIINVAKDYSWAAAAAAAPAVVS